MDDPAFQAAVDKNDVPGLVQNTEDFTKYWAEAYIAAGERLPKYILKK